MTAHPLFAQILHDFQQQFATVERARVKPEDNPDELAEPLPVVLGPAHPISQKDGE